MSVNMVFLPYAWQLQIASRTTQLLQRKNRASLLKTDVKEC